MGRGVMDFEIAPGVVVCYDSEASGLYISDGHGEIVCWVYDEIVEDPEAWTASLRAVAIAAQNGPGAVRTFLEEARG